MKVRFADWLARKLMEERGGKVRPPGGSPAQRWIDADQFEVAVIAQGDTFDIHYGREVMYSFSVPSRMLIKIAIWLWWAWWVRTVWFGIKLRLWSWALVARRTTSDKAKAEQANKTVANFVNAVEHRKV